MFMLGFALLGSTLLLPLFMQTMLGYTAEQAGLALMPGGFTIMLLLPLWDSCSHATVRAGCSSSAWSFFHCLYST